jgi:hypothetical protein
MKRLLALVGPLPFLALAIVPRAHHAEPVLAALLHADGHEDRARSDADSTAVADPSLIEIGDRATIGGSANILAH